MIHVFKTSVKTENDIQGLEFYLNNLPEQVRWNFDLEDCDNVLRIDSPVEISKTISKILHSEGFECEGLQD